MSRRKPFARRGATGRIIQSKDSELLPPTEIRRLAEAAAKGMRDQGWGTQIGQMYLRGKVAASEYSAAKRWNALVADYAVACQAPREPQTASLEARGGTPADPDSDAGVKEARKHRRDAAAFLDGKQALRLAGAIAERVVEDVCILDQAPAGLVELNALRSGLQSLAAHWSARRKANVR